MESTLTQAAAAIISKSGRHAPADAVLRDTLRKSRFDPEEKRNIAESVFTYFRWFGLLDRQRPLARQIREAAELNERFWHSPASFTAEELTTALPDWVGRFAPITPEWLAVLQGGPRLWLRARREFLEDLSRRFGSKAYPSKHYPSCALPYHGVEDLFHTIEFRDGQFEIQDVSSQAVGWLAAPGPGETWWDCCAGEGGKTLHLADLMEGRGLIWSTDAAEWRLARLRKRAARAKVFNYRAALWDVRSGRLPTKTRFDGILVDAPCSGIGTWQSNPHARWTTTPEDVAELAGLQSLLLEKVAGSLKPGGKLVYSVCTMTSAETVEVATRFEQQFPEFERFAQPRPFSSAGSAAQHLVWPQNSGGNGMFIAVWRNRK